MMHTVRFFTRLVFAFFFVGLSWASAQTRYYIAPSGDDNRTSLEAQNPATPWASLATGIGMASPGDTLSLASGTYNAVNALITKSLVIIGEGSGATRPVLVGSGSGVLQVAAPNVTIANLVLEVDQVTCTHGIYAFSPGWSGLVLRDNLILSTKVGSGVSMEFDTYGIRLEGDGDSFTALRNVVAPNGTNNITVFGRALRLRNCHGTIGGATLADSNSFNAYYGVQMSAINGGPLIIQNNVLRGIGVDIVSGSAHAHRISGNVFDPGSPANVLSCISIRDNRNAGSTITIEDNTIKGFQNIGIFAQRSANVLVRNNTFQPLATATDFRAIVVNTKQETAAATQNAFTNSITITGNDFQAGAPNVGGAIELANHNAVSTFGTVVIGGAGTEANTFSLGLNRFIILNAESGNSNTNTLWASYPVTPMRPVGQNFEADQNLFTVSGGAKRPADMTLPELYELENKLVHKSDYDSLGFITVVPGRAFVTNSSFLSPYTTAPSVARLLNGAPDGWTITSQPDVLNENITVSSDITLETSSAAAIWFNDVTLNGAGKTLTLADRLRVNGVLTLQAGHISLGNFDLVLGPSGSVATASATSYAKINGTGVFRYLNLDDQPRLFSIGTNTDYLPVTVDDALNSGLETAISVNEVASNADFTPALPGSISKFVKAQWNITQPVTGTTNATLTFSWPASAENNGPLTSNPFVARHDGSLWNYTAGTAGTNSLTASGFIAFSPFAIVDVAQVAGSKYYISPTGDNSRAPFTALNAATPWATLKHGLKTALATDTLVLLPGTYADVNDTITKTLVILGNGGSGTKPVLVGGTAPAVLTVNAPNVVIDNLAIEVDQVNVTHGILGLGGLFDGLRLEDNAILATRPGGPALTFNSYGVRLEGNGQGFTALRNFIYPKDPATNHVFGRGIRMVGVHGTIGGATLADSNSIATAIGIQAGDVRGGAIIIQNNHLFGGGGEITAATAGTHLVQGNIFDAASPDNVLSLLTLKANVTPSAIVRVENNQFRGHRNIGVFVARSAGVEILNNTFLPDGAATNVLRHLYINTKQETSAAVQSAFTNSLTVQGNTFGAPSSANGAALELANHNALGNFGTVTLGGAGTLANTFEAGLRNFLVLNADAGNSNTLTLWASYPVTPMRPVSVNLNASENLFGVSGGAKRPADMLSGELFELEDKLVHRSDYDSLGLITVLPGRAFVTANSFLTGFTTEPSLQRLAERVPAGLLVESQVSAFAGNLAPQVPITLTAPAGTTISLNNLNLNFAGELTLQAPVRVRNTLSLNQGTVQATSPLTAEADITGGNANSYVKGTLRRIGVTDAPTVFPVGTAEGYFPLTFDDDNNTGDTLTVSTQPAANAAAFSPALPNFITKLVGNQWNLTESNAGGSNATLTFTWPASAEVNGPLGSNSFLARHDGSNWNYTAGTITGQQATASGFTSFSPFAVVDIQQTAGTKYYVNLNTGNDSRSPLEATNPSTPWRTLTHAVNTTLDGDSIIVAAADYAENIEVNKSLTILGNNEQGTGPKPTISGTAQNYLVQVTDKKVTLRNFTLLVNHTSVMHGVRVPNGADSLVVTDCDILGTSPLTSGAVFASYGIRVENGGSSFYTFQRNRILPANATSNAFGRGIGMQGGYALIGGATPADSNFIGGYYALQLASNAGGAFVVRNNHLGGIGMSLVAPAASLGTFTIQDNLFEPGNAALIYATLELKDHFSSTQVNILNNRFIRHENFALLLSRTAQARVQGNTFTPAATATAFRHIQLNTKMFTSATSLTPLVNSAVIQGNTFNANGANGVALEIANHDKASSFGTLTIGGTGALANTFGAGFQAYVALDTNGTASNNYALWGTQPVTQMAPVDISVDLAENVFTVSGGAKRPATMTGTELFELEDKLIHRPEYDSLGTLFVVPNNLYVSPNSFLAPKTTTPSLSRVLNRLPDGLTINTNFNQTQVRVSTSATLNRIPNGSLLISDLEIAGAGKTLTLADPVRVTNGLILTEGFIDLGTQNLTLAGAATLQGGGPTSYVITSSTGNFVKENVGTFRFPVGTASSLASVELEDLNNSLETFSVRVKPAATINAFTPALPSGVTDFVAAQWDINEATAGGSNVTATFELWNLPGDVSTSTVVARHDGSNWLPRTATYLPATNRVVATGLSAFSPFAIYSFNAQTGGNYYYVNIATGDNSRTPLEALNPATPWRTIKHALKNTFSGDTIDVAPGTYTTNDTITNRITLLGNGGAGTQPLINGNAAPDVFLVRAKNVTIQNFQISVNQANTLNGIHAQGARFSGLKVIGNRIVSAGSGFGGPLVFGSSAIYLEGTTDTVTISRNVVAPLTAANFVFGRGVRATGTNGLLGGGTPADSNSFISFYGLQAGTPNGGPWTIRNNRFYVVGVEFNNPLGNTGTSVISDNLFTPLSAANTISMVELKNVINVGASVIVENNRFVDVANYGVFSTRSQFVTIRNNEFSALSNNNQYRFISVNTKQQTNSASQSIISNSISITGNIFRGNGANGGAAIEFANHNGTGSVQPFTGVTIGGAGALANTFESGVAEFIRLDPLTGVSTLVPLWSQYPAAITQMRPVRSNFDASQNLFGTSAGLKRPADMTVAEQLALEDKLIHRSDYDSLGFITVVPNAAYVTSRSFLTGYTTRPSLSRLSNGAADGLTLYTSHTNFLEKLSVRNSFTLEAEPDALIRLDDLVLAGAGKTLTLNDGIRLNDSLKLQAGRVVLTGTADLVLANAPRLEGGSATSYVQTNGSGGLRLNGVGTQSLTWPVGTATTYAPATLQDANNTGDSLTVRVRSAALPSSFSPVLPLYATRFINLQWNIDETTPGGSNASLTLNWTPSNEVGGPYTDLAIARHNGTLWQERQGTLGTNSVTATGFTAFSPFAVYSFVPIAGTRYYVNATGGDDTRSNAQATNPATPWATVKNALKRTVNGDTIAIFGANTYATNDTIDHQVRIVGIPVGGAKPIINGSGAPQIFLIAANTPNVTLDSLDIRVNLTSTTIGVHAPNRGFNNLTISNCDILSTCSDQPFPLGCGDLVFNSYGILLDAQSPDGVTIKRNRIRPLDLNTSSAFGRGIRMRGSWGYIGGTNLADSNFIAAAFSIQSGNPNGGPLVIQNNHLLGTGVEINNPEPSAANSVIENNRFQSGAPDAVLALLEIKENIRNTPILVQNNSFEDFSFYGIFSTRSRNVTVTGNTFSPNPSATQFRAIHVNSKQRTSSTNQPPTANDIVVTNNTFNGGNVADAGMAIEFADLNAGAPITATIGGTGTAANRFASNLRLYVRMDSLAGNSDLSSVFGTSPITTAAPANVSVDLSENLFDAGFAGFKRPATMTNAELITVEEKLQHKPDYSSLGFVTVVPTKAFVAANSFVPPFTTTPALSRAIDLVPDGGEVVYSPTVFSNGIRVDKNLSLTQLSGTLTTLDSLQMVGANKDLTLASGLKIESRLNLQAGRVQLGDRQLILAPAATLAGGSDLSYVAVSPLGRIRKAGTGTAVTVFPLGVDSIYVPLTFTDQNNTGDTISAGVRRRATANDFTVPLPTVAQSSFARLEWDLSEATPGGSNATVSLRWKASAHQGTYDPTRAFIARYTGAAWDNRRATASGFTATAPNFTTFSPFAAFSSDIALPNPGPSLTWDGNANPPKLNWCAGDSITFGLVGVDTFDVGNQFRIVMSDENGLFPATPTILASVADTLIPARVKVRLPLVVVPGSGYLFRVETTAPITVGQATTTAITIDTLPAKPTITPAGPVQICQFLDSVILRAPRGWAAYRWSTGATTDTLVVKTAGRYSVQVKGAGDCFSLPADSVQVDVLPTPAPVTVTPAGPLVFCSGDSVVLRAPAGLPGYRWNTGATTDTLVVYAPGRYQVRVQGPANSCYSDTSVAVVIDTLPLPARPAITAAGPTQFCEGDSVVLRAPTGLPGYRWSTGSTADTVVIYTSQTVSLQVQGANGCFSRPSSVLIQVNPKPAAPVITPPTLTTFCPGDSVLLIATPRAGTTYRWLLNGAAITGATADSLWAKDAGVYNVQIGTNLGCFSDTATVPVTLLQFLRPGTPAIVGTSPRSICDGDSTWLRADIPGATSYIWVLNGTFVDTTTIDSLAVGDAGDWQVIITSVQGCKSLPSAAVQLIVNPVPGLPTITAPITRLCQDDSTTFRGPAGLANYIWIRDGIIVQDDNRDSLRVGTAGTYRLVVANSFGCESDTSASILFQVDPRPTQPVITPSATVICLGDSATLRGPAGLVSYNWFLNGNPVRTTTADSLRVGDPGRYTLVVNNANCPSDSSVGVTIIVNPLPITPTITVAGPTTICASDSSLLIAPAGFPGYLWSDGSTNDSLWVKLGGTYSVRVRSATGCLSLPSADVSITVNPLPIVVVTPQGPTTFCQGDSVILLTVPGEKYQWQRDGIDLPGDTLQRLKVTIGGVYTSRVRDVNTCWGTSTAVVVTVNPLPVIDSITVTQRIAFRETTPLEVLVNPSSGPVTYSWAPIAGLDNPSIANPIASPESSTTYVVTVTNANGCTDTASVRVVVSRGAYVPSIFSPNKDNRNDTWKVYGYGIQSISIKVYNRYGNVVWSTSSVDEAVNKGWDGTAEGTELESDTYFWQISGRLVTGEELKADGKNSGTVFLNK